MRGRWVLLFGCEFRIMCSSRYLRITPSLFFLAVDFADVSEARISDLGRYDATLTQVNYAYSGDFLVTSSPPTKKGPHSPKSGRQSPTASVRRCRRHQLR